MRGEQSPNGLHYAMEHLSCKNYMTDIDTGFKYIKFDTEKCIEEEYTHKNYLLFFLEGDFSVYCNQFCNRTFHSNEMVVLPKSSMIKIRELLDLERDSYVKHIEQKSKIEIYYGTEVFNGKSDMPGSQSDVDTVCILSDGYKDKTIELMGSMKKIGIKPIFVFDSNKFSVKIIKEHLK